MNYAGILLMLIAGAAFLFIHDAAAAVLFLLACLEAFDGWREAQKEDGKQ